MRASKTKPPAAGVARRLIPLLLAAAAATVHWNSRSIPFLYDDQSAVVANESIRRLSISFTPPLHGAPVSGRPLVSVTLALNYAAGVPARLSRGEPADSCPLRGSAGLQFRGNRRRGRVAGVSC
jgi:hypothetical protein